MSDQLPSQSHKAIIEVKCLRNEVHKIEVNITSRGSIDHGSIDCGSIDWDTEQHGRHEQAYTHVQGPGRPESCQSAKCRPNPVDQKSQAMSAKSDKEKASQSKFNSKRLDTPTTLDYLLYLKNAPEVIADDLAFIITFLPIVFSSLLTIQFLNMKIKMAQVIQQVTYMQIEANKKYTAIVKIQDSKIKHKKKPKKCPKAAILATLAFCIGVLAFAKRGAQTQLLLEVAGNQRKAPLHSGGNSTMLTFATALYWPTRIGNERSPRVDGIDIGIMNAMKKGTKNCNRKKDRQEREQHEHPKT